MKTIVREPKEIDYDAFVKRSAKEADIVELVSESCMVRDEAGNIKILYLELDGPGALEHFQSAGVAPNQLAHLRWAVQTIKYSESERTGGLKTRSAIFGYAPRVAMRKDFCSATAMAKNFPKQHRVISDYAQFVSDFYKAYLPETYAQHFAITEKDVLPEWRIGKTPFTSGIVNKNNPLKYHFDSGNFNGVFSNMLVMKNGVEGGFLNCPEYDLAFEVKNRSLLIFDGQSILHGVTPITYQHPLAYRYSVVYYSLKAMWNCEPLDNELARIKKVKTERERKRLAYKEDTKL